ncbi:fumarylacetoacetate hydrolase family protein [Arsenophonus apicola]|jgi:2-keto-4-pentenoate hydratase/2-oxohepta-3-ene-1,7-dioic acid hydratase in catechol pathway|uniref:fumarylacetoacetate hydrolase family protein n=1 Tax=Arsenophonus apicola TaxID=2879119 RepID=UPI003879B8F2
MYQHHDWQGALLDVSANKVVCVGSNYAEHVQEMSGKQHKEPVIFIKPETALCDITQPILLPKGLGTVHHEIELAVLIGTTLKQENDQERIKTAIKGFAVALDLTLRDLQQTLKASGQPWEKSKAFDGACPISGFIAAHEFGDPQKACLSLLVNNEIRQEGNTADMLTTILPLISYISRFFTLRPGDVILTGTPKGVGPLKVNDELTLHLNDRVLKTRVI